ncbi:MAG: hypothetical protein WC342_03320 [Methanoregula sp.]|jgi:hypothetical protein
MKNMMTPLFGSRDEPWIDGNFLFNVMMGPMGSRKPGKITDIIKDTVAFIEVLPSDPFLEKIQEMVF